jgi:hypothetical protein
MNFTDRLARIIISALLAPVWLVSLTVPNPGTDNAEGTS